MAEDKVYPYDWRTAVSRQETEAYIHSTEKNRSCTQALEDAIARDSYEEGFRWLRTGMKEAIREFGYPRVLWVLAHALQLKADQVAFSIENTAWAQGLVQRNTDEGINLSISPAVLDALITKVRREHVAMMAQVVGQYEASHRIKESKRLTWFYSDIGEYIPNQGVTEARLEARYAEVLEKKAVALEKRQESRDRRVRGLRISQESGARHASGSIHKSIAETIEAARSVPTQAAETVGVGRKARSKPLQR